MSGWAWNDGAIGKGVPAQPVAALAGFGEKTQANILAGIAFRRQYASRHLLRDALLAAERFWTVCAASGVVRCGAAGSLRRGKEIIGDIDCWLHRRSPAVIEFFTRQTGVASVSAQGETKAAWCWRAASGGFAGGERCGIPVALAYFTGSKEHNIVMRQRAIQRGLRLNEYGLFKSEVETREAALRVPCRTEEEIFERLGWRHPAGIARGPRGICRRGAERPPAAAGVDGAERLAPQSFHWSDGRMTLPEIAARRRSWAAVIGP